MLPGSHGLVGGNGIKIRMSAMLTGDVEILLNKVIKLTAFLFFALFLGQSVPSMAFQSSDNEDRAVPVEIIQNLQTNTQQNIYVELYASTTFEDVLARFKAEGMAADRPYTRRRFFDSDLYKNFARELKETKEQVFPNGRIGTSEVSGSWPNVPVVFINLKDIRTLMALVLHPKVKALHVPSKFGFNPPQADDDRCPPMRYCVTIN